MNIWELTRSLAQEKTDLADQMARMTAHGSRDASYEGNLSDLGGGGHGGLDGKSRCTIEIDYRSSETPYSGGRDPQWGDVALGKRVGVTERVLRKMAGEGRLPVSRRRMLGLPDEGFGEEQA